MDAGVEGVAPVAAGSVAVADGLIELCEEAACDGVFLGRGEVLALLVARWLGLWLAPRVGVAVLGRTSVAVGSGAAGSEELVAAVRLLVGRALVAATSGG